MFFSVNIVIKETATRATDLSTYTDSVVHVIIALMYQFKLYTITKQHTNWKEHTSLGNAPYNYLWLNGGCHPGIYKPMKLLVTNTANSQNAKYFFIEPIYFFLIPILKD